MDDGEYELVEVTDFGQAEPRYLRGRKLPCRHIDRVDVVTLDWRPDDPASELVAQLCLDCDAQLPAGFAGVVDVPQGAASLNASSYPPAPLPGEYVVPPPSRPDPGVPEYGGWPWKRRRR